MKKLNLLAIAAMTFFMVSCGGEEKKEEKKTEKKGETAEKSETPEEPVKAEVQMKDLDLSEYGYNMTISVPEDANFEKGEYNDIIKNADNSFAITVQRLEWTKDEAFTEAKANDMNKFKNLLDETDNGYFIETELMGKADYHMFMSVNDGGEELIIFENEKGMMPKKGDSEVMFNSLKSAQAK